MGLKIRMAIPRSRRLHAWCRSVLMVLGMFGLSGCKEGEKEDDSSSFNESHSGANEGHRGESIKGGAKGSNDSKRRVDRRYAKPYAGQPERHLPFEGKALIDMGAEKEMISQQHRAHSGPPLKRLPVWKREKVQEIREARQEIYHAANKEAIQVRKKSPPERRRWVKEWNQKHRLRLRELNSQERQALHQSRPPVPSDVDIENFLQRLQADEPIFAEADLVIIEHLLPTRREMNHHSYREDAQVQGMIAAHQLLARYFPHSVDRKDIK